MSAERSWLARLLDHKGITQSELARELGTTKQQVNKLVQGHRKLSVAWAQRIAPVVDLPWVALLQPEPPEQWPPNVEHGMTVGQPGPPRVERVDDPDELALLDLWRSLSLTKRAALFGYLGADEMPSLRKSV